MTGESPDKDSVAPQADWDALAGYLAGETSDDATARVQAWLAAHPTDDQLLGALDDALSGLTLGADSTKGIDVEKALAAVKSRRGADLRMHRGAEARRMAAARPSYRWQPLATLAAAAAVIAISAVFLKRSAQPGAEPVTIAARTLTTPVGGRDSLVLPDGSQVILGPGSRLDIAEGFGQSARKVSLTGEAMFTVAHDPAKPFSVTASGTEIRDVGTAFVVHSNTSGVVRVAVTQGVVDVRTAAKNARLQAGSGARVDAAGSIVTNAGINADDELAWTRGALVFRDTPLNEVAEDLRRWYGVRLDIRDSALGRRPLSASCRGDSVDWVLDVIGLALGASIERRGDVAIVRNQR
jgi:transmembrane sensor